MKTIISRSGSGLNMSMMNMMDMLMISIGPNLNYIGRSIWIVINAALWRP